MQSTSNGDSSTHSSPIMTRHEEQTDISTNMPDLEKLGKERPKTFSGRGPELAFCFSIVMSQILAVSGKPAPDMSNDLTHLPISSIGILHHRVQRSSSDSRKRTRYPGRHNDMAHHCALPRRHINTPHIRSLN
jgi:hypothetical protein